MTTRRQREIIQLGAHLGAMVRLDEWTDAELDEATRVGVQATAQDLVYIRKTIHFIQRLGESMQRTLARHES